MDSLLLSVGTSSTRLESLFVTFGGCPQVVVDVFGAVEIDSWFVSTHSFFIGEMGGFVIED